jgi:ribosomal protein S18 acetylase RimI-like enzyme
MIMIEGVVVRKAEEKDATSITAFNISMALETEKKILAPDLVAAGVMGLLRNPAAGFYAVAEVQGVVTASLMITTEWSDWRNGTFWWIQSVFVREEFRRKGLYKRLYYYVLDLAEQEGGVCGFRLYVEQDNLTAQATYRALEMEETHYKIFEKKIFEKTEFLRRTQVRR